MVLSRTLRHDGWERRPMTIGHVSLGIRNTKFVFARSLVHHFLHHRVLTVFLCQILPSLCRLMTCNPNPHNDLTMLHANPQRVPSPRVSQPPRTTRG